MSTGLPSELWSDHIFSRRLTASSLSALKMLRAVCKAGKRAADKHFRSAGDSIAPNAFLSQNADGRSDHAYREAQDWIVLATISAADCTLPGDVFNAKMQAYLETYNLLRRHSGPPLLYSHGRSEAREHEEAAWLISHKDDSKERKTLIQRNQATFASDAGMRIKNALHARREQGMKLGNGASAMASFEDLDKFISLAICPRD